MSGTEKRNECENKKHQWGKSQMVRGFIDEKVKEASVTGSEKTFKVPQITLQILLKINVSIKQAV